MIYMSISVDLHLMHFYALAKVLLNTVLVLVDGYGYYTPPQLTKLWDLKEGHYKGLGEQNNIKALVKIQYNTIQLSDSFYHTNQTDILAYIDGIIPDGLIKDLTGQVVSLPIYSIQNHNMINYPWVSPVGELTKVLFHLYYTILYYTILYYIEN